MKKKYSKPEIILTFLAQSGFAVLNSDKEIIAAFTTREKLQLYIDSLDKISPDELIIINLPINPLLT